MLNALLIATLLTTAAAVQEEPVLHPAPMLPNGWTPSNDVVPDNEQLSMRFSLREQNLDKLVKIATEVSDPQSNMYGKYLSAAEVHKLTEPSVADSTVIQQWLGAHGVSFVNRGSNRFEVTLTIEKAKTLLRTEFYRVSNDITKQQVVRASDYSLPAGVDAVVTAMYGLHGLPLPPRTPIATPPTNLVKVTPGVIEHTYNVSRVTPSGSTKNRQAVAEFESQTMKSSDLSMFFNKYVTGSKASAIYKFVGDPGEGDAGGEASLDVDYIMGVAPGLLTEFWYYKSYDFCGDLVNWTDGIVSSDDPPLVHSVSYGFQGNLTELNCMQPNVDDVEANFVKLAARGITIIVASGDEGAAYKGSTNYCASQAEDTAVDQGHKYEDTPAPNATKCCSLAADLNKATGVFTSWTFLPSGSEGTCSVYLSVNTTKKQSGATSGGDAFPNPTRKVLLYPAWPASSPWVTAVGATRFVDNTKAGGAEMATDDFGSGGGFSSRYGAFRDQVAAVQHYLKTVPASQLPPSGSFPPGGRATPDVAALGEGFQVVADGEVQSAGGTSASTPVFAGLVSLLNEARTKAGKPAMGYLNPFLYQNAAAFRDVTIGTNAIARTGLGPPPYGFPCAPGWDPATGLGTPNFEKLLSSAMSVVGAEEQVIV